MQVLRGVCAVNSEMQQPPRPARARLQTGGAGGGGFRRQVSPEVQARDRAWREQAGVIVWSAEVADGLAFKTCSVAQCRWVAGPGISLPSLLLTRAENVELSAKFIGRSKNGLQQR
jgi:hypothetical protein